MRQSNLPLKYYYRKHMYLRGKVMFPFMSVILSTGRGGPYPMMHRDIWKWPRPLQQEGSGKKVYPQTPTPSCRPNHPRPLAGDGTWSGGGGSYGSYWKAFLCGLYINPALTVMAWARCMFEFIIQSWYFYYVTHILLHYFWKRET